VLENVANSPNSEATMHNSVSTVLKSLFLAGLKYGTRHIGSSTPGSV
jgi:hypothetical protein